MHNDAQAIYTNVVHELISIVECMCNAHTSNVTNIAIHVHYHPATFSWQTASLHITQ